MTTEILTYNTKDQSVCPVEILLVEDDPGDVLLTKKCLQDGKISNRVTVAADGVEAMDYLRNNPGTTDLILLDLNMPRKDGREVLEELHADDQLRSIPVIVLTTSDAEKDVLKSYDLQANCYITKPVDMEQFSQVVRTMNEFWFTVVKLPGRAGSGPGEQH